MAPPSAAQQRHRAAAEVRQGREGLGDEIGGQTHPLHQRGTDLVGGKESGLAHLFLL